MNHLVVRQHTLICATHAALILLASVAMESMSAAQDRRQALNSAGLVVEVGAPTASTSRLLFTRDGRHLLAAGSDKVVRQWPVAEDGTLQRDGAKVFRWAVYRQQRGTIYDMVLSPDAKQQYIAIGGMGIRNGAMALIDRTTGRIVSGTTSTDTQQVITRLSFSPSGKTVGFGTYDGAVGLWKPADGHIVILGHHPGTDVSIRALGYVTDDQLLSVAQDGSILKWNPRQLKQPPRALESLQIANVQDAEFNFNRRHLAAVGFRMDNRSDLVIRSLSSGLTRRKSFEGPDTPRLISFIPAKNQVAVEVRRNDPGSSLRLMQVSLPVFDFEAAGVSNIQIADVDQYHSALAFAPDGRSIALAGGNNQDVELFDCSSGALRDAIRSPGSSVWQVAFSDDQRSFGYRIERRPHPTHFNEMGAGTWQVFDLKRRNWANQDEQARFQPFDAINETARWKVIQGADPFVWQVVSRTSGKSQPLVFDRDQYWQPQCYTFLPGASGADDRLVIGHLWGMTMFRLPIEQAPILSRIFVGHQDEVTAVAPSRDGKLLLSASRDQTVACWSLADWPHQQELGASFARRGEQLEVAEVAAGSPGWEAGLQPGDQLERLHYDAKLVEGGMTNWSDILTQPSPGRELLFKVRRGGSKDAIDLLTTVRQRPLWVFFPTRQRDWMLWRWRDYYYDCSLHGDDYVGWQTSGDVDETPVFTTAEQSRQRFHRPDKVAELVEHRAYDPERVASADYIPPRMELAIRASNDRGVQAIVKSDVTADRLAAEPAEIALWVNDYVVRRWSRPALPFAETVAIPAGNLRAGKNDVVVHGYSQYGVRGEAEQQVDAPGSESKPSLIALCVGVSEYHGLPAGNSRGDRWPDLLSAETDADAVFQALEQQRDAGVFKSVRLALLTNSQVSRKAVFTYLASAAETAQANDVFILFMAGHGWAQESTRSTHVPDTFAFVTPQFDAGRSISTGLRFVRDRNSAESGTDTLYDMLSRIRARKLILLDCCHAGGGTEMIRCLNPARRVGPAILVACGTNEFAWDLPMKGHGAFTCSLLECLGERFSGSDTDRNHRVDVAELSLQIERRVPQLIRLASPCLVGLEPGQTQQPQSYLTESVAQTALFGRATQGIGRPSSAP